MWSRPVPAWQRRPAARGDCRGRHAAHRSTRRATCVKPPNTEASSTQGHQRNLPLKNEASQLCKGRISSRWRYVFVHNF